MIYFVALLIIVIAFLSIVILRLKSKETFVLDDVPNKPNKTLVTVVQSQVRKQATPQHVKTHTNENKKKQNRGT